MKRLAFVAAMTLLAAPALAETASSPLGVAVEIPEGYTWKEGYKFKPTTAIYMEGKGPQVPAIVVNAQNMRRELDEDDVFEQTKGAFKTADVAEVNLGSGRYLRVDFVVEDPPRKLKQRLYAAVRGTYLYYFFLINVDEAEFAKHVPTFDAVVASASFSKPKPPAPKPDPEPPAPEPAEEPAEAPAEEPAASDPPAKPEGGGPPKLKLEAGASSEATKPETVKPEAAKPEPAKPAAADPSERGPAVPLKMIRWTSEYDPDVWAALHLIDGKLERGWCSSPSDKAPFGFVFEQPTGSRVAHVQFDNKCPEERGFEGVSTQSFTLEGSDLGPERGYAVVLEGTLEPGKNGQVFALSEPSSHRYLRLSITSNHGHARLTELMEFSATAPAGAEPLTGFHLDRVRTSREKNGTAEGQPFKPGERVWINFKPRDLNTNPEGSTWLEVDLVLGDSEGNELLRRDKVVNHVAKPPKSPLSPFVSLYLDLPAAFPAGKYVVRLIARDKVGKTSAAAKSEFLVGE